VLYARHSPFVVLRPDVQRMDDVGVLPCCPRCALLVDALDASSATCPVCAPLQQLSSTRLFLPPGGPTEPEIEVGLEGGGGPGPHPRPGQPGRPVDSFMWSAS
jgi:hypothetical protein